MVLQYSTIIKHLKLEITETQIMSNAEHSSYMLEKLKSMGFRLALDDFGTGYSSLSYLHRFPFDTIKIPAPFVQIGNEERLTRTQTPIIRSVLSLAKELDMNVIAEGVETQQELKRLISLDCKYAQGYLFGAPMSHKEFHKKLSAQFAKAKR
ncbi:MAG: EAL domain-containing protein, partial [Devosiaceae bacterium]|nr:EAL domain-containing protein [Devosiaceae bacterium]